MAAPYRQPQRHVRRAGATCRCDWHRNPLAVGGQPRRGRHADNRAADFVLERPLHHKRLQFVLALRILGRRHRPTHVGLPAGIARSQSNACAPARGTVRAPVELGQLTRPQDCHTSRFGLPCRCSASPPTCSSSPYMVPANRAGSTDRADDHTVATSAVGMALITGAEIHALAQHHKPGVVHQMQAPHLLAVHPIQRPEDGT